MSKINHFNIYCMKIINIYSLNNDLYKVTMFSFTKLCKSENVFKIYNKLKRVK